MPRAASLMACGICIAKGFIELTLLTYPEAADALKVHVRTLQREIDAGALPFVEVRGAKRIAQADLDAYIARNRRYSAQPCPSASTARITTFASKSADDALSALLAPAGRTQSRSKTASAPRQLTPA